MNITSIVTSVFGYFGKAVLVLLAYWTAKSFVLTLKSFPEWRGYLKTILGVAVVSLFLMSTYGTHTEFDGNDYELYGSGETVEDFEPTQAQRAAHGLTMFIVFLIPALIGTKKGYEELNLNK